MTARRYTAWPACVVTGLAVFLCGLDHLVLLTALPAIRSDLGRGVDAAAAGWFVNAYLVPVAVLPPLVTRLAARFGQRRVFTAALVVFTAGSATAACSATAALLTMARMVQGTGAAAIAPLSLTLVAAAVPVHRRPVLLGVWGALGGLAVAVGPVVGGAVVQWGGWQYVFWINVPLGILLVAAARSFLREPSTATAAAATAPTKIGPSAGWQIKTRRFRQRSRLCRGLHAVHFCGFLMHAGVFGTVFWLAQFPQTVQGHSPWEAGLRILPWTAMPLLVAPLAGLVMGRTGARPVLVAAFVLTTVSSGWFALFLTPQSGYVAQLPGLLAGGMGMALFFTAAPEALLANASDLRVSDASGFNSSVREIGALAGVGASTVLFTHNGSTAGPAAFTHGLTAVLWGGVAVAGLGLLAAAATGPARIRVAERTPPSAVDAAVTPQPAVL
ncbi:MFS transporter [Streptomyces sp. ISL-66]|uniref:MFS transporter n=1 Tax=Streptomyces sp. ISL-66 TaxID=2819186 RepID=UPI001BE591F7|nr:MFS transporter [Streptomyces sp. ISL-66]MBT2472183.1 MFS transporter [Streptomyces sp. ISL-66]